MEETVSANVAMSDAGAAVTADLKTVIRDIQTLLKSAAATGAPTIAPLTVTCRVAFTAIAIGSAPVAVIVSVLSVVEPADALTNVEMLSKQRPSKLSTCTAARVRSADRLAEALLRNPTTGRPVFCARATGWWVNSRKPRIPRANSRIC